MTTQPEQIRAALSYIDSTDRSTWIKMGAAVKTELGESGFNIWDEWSQSAQNYNARAAQTAWKSLKEGRVNIGTLFYEAKQRGFTPERNPQPLSREEVKRRQLENEQKRIEQANKERELKDNAIKKAQARWHGASTEVDIQHPYLVKKGINHPAITKGLRMEEGNLLIPLKQLGTVYGLQSINNDGQKRFNEFATVAGSSYLIGDWSKAKHDKELIICEGFATGASIHLATGKAVVVCFTGNNLEKVAAKIAQNTDVNVVIAADWDRSGMGAKYAMDAKQQFEQGTAIIKFPDFTQAELAQDNPPSDFNDLAKLRGLEHVKVSFNEAFKEFESPEKEQRQQQSEEAQQQNREQESDANRELESEALKIIAQSSRPTPAQIEGSHEADTDIDAKFGQITGLGTVPSEALIQANNIRGLKSLKPAQQVIVKASIAIANKTMDKVDHSLRGDIKRNYVENLEKAINTNTLNIPKELESFVEQKLQQQQKERDRQSIPDLVL